MQIDVDAVTFVFGRRPVIAAFSATFASKGVTALVGPSGSGKSTLLSAIGGYRRPRAGSIRFVRPDRSSHPPQPGLVSWVAQDVNALSARTVIDNVMVGPLSEGIEFGEAHARATTAIEEVGLRTHLGSRLRTLSGGEKQRVTIARALASSRPVVLADEPSSGLDEMNTRNLANLFCALRDRCTVIIATHDPVMMRAATSIVHIRSGS